MIVAICGTAECARILLTEKNIDMTLKDRENMTALDLARLYKNDAVSNVLERYSRVT
jgi:hypothetical protein